MTEHNGYDLTSEQRAEQFVQNLDDNLLYCRAKRRHRLPVVLPPRRGRAIKVPRGFNFYPAEGRPGCFITEETCEICGRVVISITEPGGYRGTTVRRRYVDPKGYAAPKGTGDYLRGSLAHDELERRLIAGGLFGMPE